MSGNTNSQDDIRQTQASVGSIKAAERTTDVFTYNMGRIVFEVNPVHPEHAKKMVHDILLSLMKNDMEYS